MFSSSAIRIFFFFGGKIGRNIDDHGHFGLIQFGESLLIGKIINDIAIKIYIKPLCISMDRSPNVYLILKVKKIKLLNIMYNMIQVLCNLYMYIHMYRYL